MKWNWEVFLKSWLFGFLGLLLGIVSTIIYLAIDVDLSKLDGLQILTGVLVIITIWYAISTHKILDDQRKSRQLAEIDKKLEMFYQPLENLFKISTYRQFVKVIDRGVSLEPSATISFNEKNAYSYLYLACDEVKEFLQIIMTGLLPEDMDAKVFYQMYGDIEDIVTKKISELKDERTKLLG